MRRPTMTVIVSSAAVVTASVLAISQRPVRAAIASLLLTGAAFLPESVTAHLAAQTQEPPQSPACAAQPATSPGTSAPTGLVAKGDGDWKPVRIGAGGYLTGMDVAADGTMVVRTDTHGAYRWTGNGWQQLVTAASMPQVTTNLGGVYELRIAPNDPRIFYLQNQEGIWRSQDRGQSWQKTSLTFATDPNGKRRTAGQKLAIDPRNPAVVYAGTQKEGLWRTRDGGLKWEQVAAVPQGTGLEDASLTGIIIRDREIFVGTAGVGVYRSQDAGQSWQSVGGPPAVRHAALTASGTYLASQNDDGSLWSFAGGKWTRVMDKTVHAIAIDPRNPEHIVVTNDGGSIMQSQDEGRTWQGWNWANSLESSDDIPWLERSGKYMSSGGLAFDPRAPGRLWQAAGVGAWQTTLAAKLEWNTPVVWHAQSRGIEQLVSNEMVAPPGGTPTFASWDRPFFQKTDLDRYSDCYGGGDFSMGWSIDYATTDPKFLVGISDWWDKEESGFSADGGRTWQKFAGTPTWAKDTVGGAIAASTPSNIIWVPAGGKPPAYTLNGGKSWQDVSVAGVNAWPNLHQAYYLNRQTIAADRVTPNVFYLTDSETGVYRSADGGRTWERMNGKPPQQWSVWNARLEAVPGRAGHLYFSSGPQGSDGTKLPDALPLVRSSDGGRSWGAVPGMRTINFGFGAPVQAGGPAAIYAVGFYRDQFGIWGSPDDGRSWVSLGRRPMGSLDSIKAVSGDMARPGVVYVGFGGSGYAYLRQ